MSMQPQSGVTPDDADRMLASTTAALLRSVLALRPLSLGAAAMSLLALIGPYGSTHGIWVVVLLTASLVTGVPVLYLMFRIDFDARLFENLAGRPVLRDALGPMDHALKALGLVKEVSARPLVDRVHGARKLVARALARVALQLLLLLAAAIAITAL